MGVCFSHKFVKCMVYLQGSASSRLIQVSIIAESVKLQQVLATHGVPSQTPSQVEPIQIWSPNVLKRALKYMGINDKLHLSGRPERPIGLFGTSMVSQTEPSLLYLNGESNRIFFFIFYLSVRSWCLVSPHCHLRNRAYCYELGLLREL